MEVFLFFIVILFSNIVQGITGFAGTILAMPPSLVLMGYETAKPVLNVLGLLSGLYVFYFHRSHVNYKELKRVVWVMSIGILGGIFLKSLFIGNQLVLYHMLGVFIIGLGIKGLMNIPVKIKIPWLSEIILLLSGIVHGMFVSGGPLLIGYMSDKIKDKQSFRATISTVWIVLNTIVLFDDWRSGYWNLRLVVMTIFTVPFLFLGMWLGSKLYARLSQALFMKITYVLLGISGIMLLMK